jgi:hypothetical protein
MRLLVHIRPTSRDPSQTRLKTYIRGVVGGGVGLCFLGLCSRLLPGCLVDAARLALACCVSVCSASLLGCAPGEAPRGSPQGIPPWDPTSGSPQPGGPPMRPPPKGSPRGVPPGDPPLGTPQEISPKEPPGGVPQRAPTGSPRRIPGSEGEGGEWELAGKGRWVGGRRGKGLGYLGRTPRPAARSP